MMNGLKEDKKYLSVEELKGMQSVRATFSLPGDTINLLSVVANQLGVKQKSIFDHLIEDKQVLKQVAKEAHKGQGVKKKRKQKTFVLSRNSLDTLDRTARDFALPRDLLVEFSIQRLLPVMDREKKRHESRKGLLTEMEAFLEAGRQMMTRACRLVGEDDRVCRNLEEVLALCAGSVDDLKKTIEKGRCIEEV